jgi:hypothetical protein
MTELENVYANSLIIQLSMIPEQQTSLIKAQLKFIFKTYNILDKKAQFNAQMLSMYRIKVLLNTIPNSYLEYLVWFKQIQLM